MLIRLIYFRRLWAFELLRGGSELRCSSTAARLRIEEAHWITRLSPRTASVFPSFFGIRASHGLLDFANGRWHLIGGRCDSRSQQFLRFLIRLFKAWVELVGDEKVHRALATPAYRYINVVFPNFDFRWHLRWRPRQYSSDAIFALLPLTWTDRGAQERIIGECGSSQWLVKSQEMSLVQWLSQADVPTRRLPPKPTPHQALYSAIKFVWLTSALVG